MEILVTKIKGNGYFFIPKYAREADSGKFSVSPCVREETAGGGLYKVPQAARRKI